MTKTAKTSLKEATKYLLIYLLVVTGGFALTLLTLQGSVRVGGVALCILVAILLPPALISPILDVILDAVRERQEQAVRSFLRGRYDLLPNPQWVKVYLEEHAEKFCGAWAKELFNAYYMAFYKKKKNLLYDWCGILRLIPSQLTKHFLDLHDGWGIIPALVAVTPTAGYFFFPSDVRDTIIAVSTSDERREWLVKCIKSSGEENWRHARYLGSIYKIPIDDKVMGSIVKAAMRSDKTTSADVLLLMRALEDSSKREEILHFFENH